jgi:putative flippase GtrA
MSFFDIRYQGITHFMRFVATGLLNTGFGYLCYAGLVLIDMPRWLAVAGSTVMGILFNFFSYGSLVFGTTSARVLPHFLGLYTLLGLINFWLLNQLDAIGIGPLVSQALLLPILAVLSYFGMRSLFSSAAGKAG